LFPFLLLSIGSAEFISPARTSIGPFATDIRVTL
jgi:hypothetical protein